MTKVGIDECDVCNRDGCTGTLEYKVENCSCHISPPCSACIDAPLVCTECGFKIVNEQMNDHVLKVDNSTNRIISWELRELDNTKIDWHSVAHTHFSMIKRGVYPVGVTQAEVLKEVKGTFGGHFTRFGSGKFEYIAYTD